MKNIVVPVFIPHLGCPYQCSFCNQRVISGRLFPITPTEVVAVFQKAQDKLCDKAKGGQLAFFGGSFTAVDKSYRRSLLEAALPFTNGQKGCFSGIRISTRPDCIDEEILKELKEYNVKAIELGVQSLSDKVLLHNNRGHSARDVENASALIRKHGFELGHQMMTGLYKDDETTALCTANKILALKPDTLRIYPTLTLGDTRLEQLYIEGKYRPQTLKQSIKLSTKLIRLLNKSGINLIRLGLQDEVGLLDNVVAGPYHPSYAELCISRALVEDLLVLIKQSHKTQGTLKITVHPKAVSKLIGFRRNNIKILRRLGFDVIIIQDDRMQISDILPEIDLEIL